MPRVRHADAAAGPTAACVGATSSPASVGTHGTARSSAAMERGREEKKLCRGAGGGAWVGGRGGAGSWGSQGLKRGSALVRKAAASGPAHEPGPLPTCPPAPRPPAAPHAATSPASGAASRPRAAGAPGSAAARPQRAVGGGCAASGSTRCLRPQPPCGRSRRGSRLGRAFTPCLAGRLSHKGRKRYGSRPARPGRSPPVEATRRRVHCRH
jgi:hypothetical protein